MQNGIVVRGSIAWSLLLILDFLGWAASMQSSTQHPCPALHPATVALKAGRSTLPGHPPDQVAH